MKKVIIDCDPGIDDSLALLMALNSPEIHILGITTVSGNVNSIKGAKNAIRVLELVDRLDIPVYVGETRPLVREFCNAEDTHGEDGLGECGYGNKEEYEVKYGAVDFILDTISKEDVTILALGPLTNLAKALERDKSRFNKIKEIISMGGAFKSHGNCSPVAEYNYWVDPHAVKYFLENNKVPITIVPLDVTREIILTPNYRELINQFNTEIGKFIVDITKFYVDFHWKQERTLGCVINDPLVIGYLLDKSICEEKEYYCQCVTDGIVLGQLMVDVGEFYRKESNAKILTKVDSNKFMSMFFKSIFKDHERDIDLIINNTKYGV